MSNAEKPDPILESILTKIDDGSVTCEDFDHLISETTPEAVRDRVRRHTLKTTTDSHIEPETGHQQLELPTFADRVQPKRKPENQQSHGRAKLAHAHSARTQARDHSALPPRFEEAMKFITKHSGSPLTDEMLSEAVDRTALRVLATKLIKTPSFDRDWLFELVNKLS